MKHNLPKSELSDLYYRFCKDKPYVFDGYQADQLFGSARYLFLHDLFKG